MVSAPSKTIVAGVYPFAPGVAGAGLPVGAEPLGTSFVPGHGIVVSFAVDAGAKPENRELLFVPHGAEKPDGAVFCGQVTAVRQAERRILAPVGDGPAAQPKPEVVTLFVFLLPVAMADAEAAGAPL